MLSSLQPPLLLPTDAMERSDRVNDTGGLGTVGGLARDGGGGGAKCSDLLIDRAFTFFFFFSTHGSKKASKRTGREREASELEKKYGGPSREVPDPVYRRPTRLAYPLGDLDPGYGDQWSTILST